MKPKTPETSSNRDMFRPLLVDIINPQHELVLLERVVDWSYLERECFTTTEWQKTHPELFVKKFTINRDPTLRHNIFDHSIHHRLSIQVVACCGEYRIDVQAFRAHYRVSSVYLCCFDTQGAQ
jgi:hypothetical protein